ncbi:MAG: hypothetical protein WCZ86_06080 [Desulfurivibrionaceae bacterium]
MSARDTIHAPITGMRPTPITRHEEFGIGLKDICEVTEEGDAIASIYKESIYFHRRGETRVRAHKLPLGSFPVWTHGFMPACDPGQLWVKVEVSRPYPDADEVFDAFRKEVIPPEG